MGGMFAGESTIDTRLTNAQPQRNKSKLPQQRLPFAYINAMLGSIQSAIVAWAQCRRPTSMKPFPM